MDPGFLHIADLWLILSKYSTFLHFFQVASPILFNMDQITVKTPNPECRYWYLIEFMDWRYSQSCWYSRPLLWTSAPLTFSLVHLLFLVNFQEKPTLRVCSMLLKIHFLIFWTSCGCLELGRFTALNFTVIWFFNLSFFPPLLHFWAQSGWKVGIFTVSRIEETGVTPDNLTVGGFSMVSKASLRHVILLQLFFIKDK